MFSKLISQFLSRGPRMRLGSAAAQPTGAMLRPGGGASVHRQLARAANVQPGAVRTLLDGGNLRALHPGDQVRMHHYLQAALRSPATPTSAQPALAQHARRLAMAMDPAQHAARLASSRAREGDRVASKRLDAAESIIAEIGHRTRQLRMASRLEAHPALSQLIYADIFSQHSTAVRLLGEAGDWAQSAAVGGRMRQALTALDAAMREAVAHAPVARRR